MVQLGVFEVVEDTGTNLSLRSPFLWRPLRVRPYKTFLPGSPGIATKRLEESTAVHDTDAVKLKSFVRDEGGMYSLVTYLSHLTIDHALLSRQITVPTTTANRDTSNNGQ